MDSFRSVRTETVQDLASRLLMPGGGRDAGVVGRRVQAVQWGEERTPDVPDTEALGLLAEGFRSPWDRRDQAE
ncbi:hypothetical protein Vlu01_31210 [Micromonospora lutea]|uniref:Uncharacterized protein n=1 Tax=Micromonospora lutea TaxID=419825 RepID=A0ABQ4IX45_9ACTN|nr:hypothetical protein Vlu01_31210 [Micromonospora lutea]